ncbi:MAG: alpha-galactosidase [Verrucomicrobiia bacterium]
MTYPKLKSFFSISTIFALALEFSLYGVNVTEQELNKSRLWSAVKFDGKELKGDNFPGLYVVANHDPVIKNQRAGRNLKIADTEFNRGLYCHAFSKIIVKLPSAAESFSALAGIDSNQQTAGGRGSVIFIVQVNGQEKFRSAVMREGMKAEKVNVDLNGASEFILQIDATPDGISCDQSDWADAKVKLKNGKEIYLDELPFREVQQSLFSTELPFSFIYDGKPSSDILKNWNLTRNHRSIDKNITEHTLVWTEPQNRLSVKCVAIEYHDFPVIEWTLYFKNNSNADAPIIQDIKALDVKIDGGNSSRFLLHHNVGSPADGNDYKPLETLLKPGTKKRLAAAGGRPTSVDWSYFNLEKNDGEGLIFAIGWPGQWAGEFECFNTNSLRIVAGQENTKFKLHPAEEVRTPLIAILFWEGNWLRGQNIWRRFMMAHSMPKPGGKLPPPQFAASSSRQYDEMIRANETNQIMFINRYIEEGFKLDYWWMDAGWYEHHGGGWPKVGSWFVDTNRFPRGLKAISDYAHQRGIKIIVWFEPERVAAGTWLAKNHPDWILGGEKGGLLNLGNKEALHWLIEHIDNLITSQGIDLYRQDFNIDPLPFWRSNDPPDRQGITEIKYITGLLAFWDELKKRHPDMLIDACASGGRRNDLEIMRRAVPLWRSDYAFESTGHQCMTYGISLWLPYYGTGTVATRNATYYGSGKTPVEPYAFWSNVSPSLGFGIDFRIKDIDYPQLRKLVSQWRLVITNYFGDFYPLTQWSRDNSHWIAWQFDKPEENCGLIQAFRRENSPYESVRLKLNGLERAAFYKVTDINSPEKPVRVKGEDLINNGLLVQIIEQPGTAVITYVKE